MNWSKSPKALAERAARTAPQLCHLSVARGITACGRRYGSNSSIWTCSSPADATCPRCITKAQAPG